MIESIRGKKEWGLNKERKGFEKKRRKYKSVKWNCVYEKGKGVNGMVNIWRYASAKVRK